MSLLAIDIGSSSCKAIVFAADGRVLAQHSFGCPAEFPAATHAELNPDGLWDTLCTACRSNTRDLAEPVRALCLSSHGETFVPVDRRGRPVMNAILNQDTRAVHETGALEQRVGRRRLFDITGLTPHPMYPLPKILWLRQHRPAIFEATATYVTLIGYLLQKMGFPPYVDHSLASRYLAFDVRSRAWSREILDAAGLNESCLPTPLPAGTLVGRLGSEAASMLGLAAGTAVVLGGHDQPCSALASGAVGSGRVSHSIGTYECLLAASDTPSLNDSGFEAALNTYCHVVPDKYVTLAYFPSGMMVKWFHDLLGASAAEQFAQLEATAPEGPTGLIVTPHLVGSGNPDFNPHARGAILGLSPGTHRAQLHKGILEGQACELALVTQALACAAGPITDLYVTGGGARSKLGMRLRAALTGCRLHRLEHEEAACLGTAMLAGIAVGEFANTAQAIAACVREREVIEPNAAMAALYTSQTLRYRHIRKEVN
ncbi:MAG: hypothetical protein JSR66_26570 [Proteobacteria bacterium]|nr:hypothetical protein [Pseudomonadota bacterium]